MTLNLDFNQQGLRDTHSGQLYSATTHSAEEMITEPRKMASLPGGGAVDRERVETEL